MAFEPDFVSDLNGTGDATVSVNEGNVSSVGADAVDINNQNPAAKTAPDAAAPDDKAKPLSLRDQISSALKGEGDTPPAASKDGQVRDPVTGQFVPKPAEQPVDPTAPAPQFVAAPQGFDPQVFQTLPAETQNYIARTMDDLGQRQQRFASLEQVEQLIAPRREAWALNGMTESQALNQLLALSDYAGRDPAGFIQYLAQNTGVDLEQLVLGQEPVDPKYATLEQKIQRMEYEKAQEQQQRAQAAHNDTVNGVVAFASEKGQDGQLLRPYFDELGTEVLPFINAVKAQNPQMSHSQVLQEAYDRACWGSPTVRAKMQAAANAASEAERLRTEAERVGKARNASVGVRPSTPATAQSASNNGGGNLRDTIRAAMASANGA